MSLPLLCGRFIQFNWKRFISLTDEECNFKIYVNDSIHGNLNTEGFVTIVRGCDFALFISKLEMDVEDYDAFEIMKVTDFQGELLICLRSGTETSDIDIIVDDYIYYDDEVHDFIEEDNSDFEVTLQFKEGDKLSKIVSISEYNLLQYV